MNEITEQITFLPCRNLQETHTFYTQILKFTMVVDQGTCRIYQTTSNSFLGFCKKEKYASSEHTIITFIVNDVDQIVKRIEQMGWEIEMQPRINNQYQIYQSFLRDPNGHLIEIQRFLHPFPQRIK